MMIFSSKTTIYIENDDQNDQISPIFDIIELFQYQIEFRIEIGHGFRIVSSRRVDQTAGIEL